jgi:hypothetical protein
LWSRYPFYHIQPVKNIEGWLPFQNDQFIERSLRQRLS